MLVLLSLPDFYPIDSLPLRTPARVSPAKVDASFDRFRKDVENRTDSSHSYVVASNLLAEVDTLVASGAPQTQVRKVKQKFVMEVMIVRNQRDFTASQEAAVLNLRRRNSAEKLEAKLAAKERSGRKELESSGDSQRPGKTQNRAKTPWLLFSVGRKT